MSDSSTNVSSHFMIYVDAADDGVLSGSYYNNYMERPDAFFGLEQLFLLIDEWNNRLNYPHEYFEPRYFVEWDCGGSDSALDGERDGAPVFHKTVAARENGKLATFKVDVLFRQNASWQGNVSWQERQIEKPFRSCLELTRMIVSAVRNEGKAFTLL